MSDLSDLIDLSDDVGFYPGSTDEEEAAPGRDETTEGGDISSFFVILIPHFQPSSWKI